MKYKATVEAVFETEFPAKKLAKQIKDEWNLTPGVDTFWTDSEGDGHGVPVKYRKFTIKVAKA